MGRSEYEANRYMGQRSWNSALQVAKAPKKLCWPWWGTAAAFAAAFLAGLCIH